jgi:hypothetical protein
VAVSFCEEAMQKKMLMTKEEIIAAIADCAVKLGRAPSIRELKATAKINMRKLRWHFDSYTNALRAAGIKAKDPGMTPLELLFADWTRVTRALGKIPTLEEYEKHGEYSGTPFQRRFRKWTNVPRGLQEYAEERGLLAGWEDVKQMVDTIRTRQSVMQQRKTRQASTSGLAIPVDAMTMALALPDLPMYGAPVGLPGMAHAPINEMGVVYLFGAMATELGFLVTRIQSGYPDCEAMRKVDEERWQRVRIEFEFESRNFFAHHHDPKECDLVVCWTHNWPECPLPVLELKVMAAFENRRG